MTRNTPAAKLESNPLQAMPIATPAAAIIAANGVVSTPKKLKIAIASAIRKVAANAVCRYPMMVGSFFRNCLVSITRPR